MKSDEVKHEVKKVENNFLQWLEMSDLTENDFLKFRTMPDFKILSGIQDSYRIVVWGHEKDGNFMKFGEQFAYVKTDLSAFESLALLMFFMAQKLDNANAKAPKFEQRPAYFFNRVKEFIENCEEYKTMQEIGEADIS